MLFKLYNAAANFQNYINKILAKKTNIFFIFYINNIFFLQKQVKLSLY